MPSPIVHPPRWSLSSSYSFCLRNSVISSKVTDRTIFCPVLYGCPWCSLHDSDIYGIMCLLRQSLKCSLTSLSQRVKETCAELNCPVTWVLSSNTAHEAKRDEEGWRTIQRPISSTLLSNSGFQGPFAPPCCGRWCLLAHSVPGSQCNQPQTATSPWSCLTGTQLPWDHRTKQPIPRSAEEGSMAKQVWEMLCLPSLSRKFKMYLHTPKALDLCQKILFYFLFSQAFPQRYLTKLSPTPSENIWAEHLPLWEILKQWCGLLCERQWWPFYFPGWRRCLGEGKGRRFKQNGLLIRISLLSSMDSFGEDSVHVYYGCNITSNWAHFMAGSSISGQIDLSGDRESHSHGQGAGDCSFTCVPRSHEHCNYTEQTILIGVLSTVFI